MSRARLAFERTPIGWPTNLAAKLYINETVVAEVNSTIEQR